MDAFYADVGAAYKTAVKAFYEAGCRYLQLDDISFAYLCDPEQRAMLRRRGDDPERQPDIYAGMVRQALEDKPSDLTVTMHLCRGNFRSTFIASGGYELVAELLFNAMPVDGYFMEWDTDRAGGFKPLRFLPAERPSCSGWSRRRPARWRRTTSSAASTRRRSSPTSTSSASRRNAASPRPRGNILAEDEQWAKSA